MRSIKDYFGHLVFVGLFSTTIVAGYLTNRPSTSPDRDKLKNTFKDTVKKEVTNQKFKHQYDRHTVNLVLDTNRFAPNRKWKAGFGALAEELLSRYQTHMQNPDNCRIVNNWLSKLGNLQKLSWKERVNRVNKIVNSGIAYVPDRYTYKEREHWATPVEVIKKRKGDCEDFAILKCYALWRAGIPLDRIYFTAVSDSQMYGADHAVALVDLSDAGDGTDVYVLDIMQRSTLPLAKSMFYPKYALGSDGVTIAARTDDSTFFSKPKPGK